MAEILTTAVITNLGAELQAKLMTGAAIGITSVKTGSGSVDITDLRNQTAVSDIKQTATIQFQQADVYSAIIAVMIANKGLSEAYGLRQIGFYAEDPDRGEILYAIAQTSAAISIPNEVDSPFYSLVWNVHFNLSNELNLSITINPAGMVAFSALPIVKGTGLYSAQLPDGASEALEEGGMAFAKGSKAKKFNTMFGKYPKECDGAIESSNTYGDLVVIGNGTPAMQSNSHRFCTNGKTFALGAYNSQGADYAEFFEWSDMNQNNEDRRGLFVTMIGDKIKIAESDEYVLGVVSGNPSVIGNSDEDYHGKWVRDEYGSLIIKNGELVLDPKYDSSLPYIPRMNRKEWATVGMVGQLVVRDDGTCMVNGFCKVGTSGAATACERGYIESFRVVKRMGQNLIKIVLK